MERVTENKIVLVTQKTRLENLIQRYNTVEQAEFYVQHHGGDFTDYRLEHDTYYKAVKTISDFLQHFARLQIVDREFVPKYLFGNKDLVIAVGRDGLVANTLKYLNEQQLIGVNPDPKRWDGILLPFYAEDIPKIVPEFYKGLRKNKRVTLAEASLNDGQKLYGVNDLFIGQKGHASARYELKLGEKAEIQSSSGIVVSTGLGSTGWFKSILAGARGIDRFYGICAEKVNQRFAWDSSYLMFNVREPYPSTSTGANVVFGKIELQNTLTITSLMPENGVIFSDGVEQDFLQFNSGAIAKIGIADKCGILVV